MEKETFVLEKMALLFNVGIFSYKENAWRSYGANEEQNPIWRSSELQNILMEGTKKQREPFLYKDENQVYFCCIEENENFYCIGPMCVELLSRVELHQFYRRYHMAEKQEHRLKKFQFREVIHIVEVLAAMIQGETYEEEQLYKVNQLIKDTRQQDEEEQVLQKLKEDEEALYHHTYQEERELLDCVRDGRVVDALKRTHEMDRDLGKLSSSEIRHWKNAVVVGITLCTRAAIEGGVAPSIAYRLSDFYIQKSDSSDDIAQIIEYRNRAVEALTVKVYEKLQKKKSNYVEQCQDYIRKHYREKIYQQEIADVLGISTSYLSRLYKRETGENLQEYLNQVRLEHAANLLKYSQESLSSIAEYVNFPSQSYFGKVFKQKYHLSPKKYRELKRPAEYITTK